MRHLARGWRILFVFVAAAAVVMAVFALVDRIYILYFFDPATIVVPSYISMGMGAAMYIWGYYLFVGTRGTTPPARRGRVLYMGIALLAILTSAALIIHGLTLTDLFVG